MSKVIDAIGQQPPAAPSRVHPLYLRRRQMTLEDWLLHGVGCAVCLAFGLLLGRYVFPANDSLAASTIVQAASLPAADYAQLHRLAELTVKDLKDLQSLATYKASYDALNAEINRLRQLGQLKNEGSWLEFARSCVSCGNMLVSGHQIAASKFSSEDLKRQMREKIIHHADQLAQQLEHLKQLDSAP